MKLIIVLIVIVAVVTIILVLIPSGQVAPKCGDGVCDEVEKKSGSCPQDCGAGEECKENWTCTEWSSCSAGKQTRSCVDSNNCGTTLQKPKTEKTCGAIVEGIYYFIAVHNEPYSYERDYPILKQFVEEANKYNIKLTLMLTAQWADYISQSTERMADLASWKNQGHEIAAHHHSVYHLGWDGYTSYSKEEAKTIRDKYGLNTSTYLGTLTAYIDKLKKVNSNVKSGCVNDEHDKSEMPDEIIYDTCSGFANYGEPGTRYADYEGPEKGKNEYVTVGTYKNITRKWLTHYQIPTDDKQKQAQTVFNSMSSGVYGVVVHSSSGEKNSFLNYLKFLHSKDPNGERSKTVAEIIKQKLLPEKTISDELVNTFYPPMSFSPTNQTGGTKLCGDGTCDSVEQANPNLCPQDCGEGASPCGDGVCDAFEQANPNLCPQDCK